MPDKLKSLMEKQAELQDELEKVESKVLELQQIKTAKEVQAIVKELQGLAKSFRFGKVHKAFKSIQDRRRFINGIDPKFTSKAALTSNPYGIAERDTPEIRYIIENILCGRQGLPFSSFLKLIASNRPGNPFLPKEER